MDREFEKYKRWREYEKDDFTANELDELNRLRQKYEVEPQQSHNKRLKKKKKRKKRQMRSNIGSILRGFGKWSMNVQENLFDYP